MKRFGGLLVAAALGAALAAGGPGLAFGRGGGGGGGHFGGFGPRFAGRSVGMGHFDRRFFDRGDRFRRFGRFDRDDRSFFRRGRFANGLPFWIWGGDWGYPYGDNGYSGYNYPGGDNSYSTGAAFAPFMIGGSAATGQRWNSCIISVKACQLHNPPYVGDDCSCKVPGRAASEVP
ncbi:MAG: hypothetical protein ACREDT_02290 [Methylocella sp.]